jgi:hypothetical protein
LSALIDRGYALTFGIQLDLEGTHHEPEIYTFDEEDRRIWGETQMLASYVRLWKNGEPVLCYASSWIDSLFRLVCIADRATPDLV